MSSLIYSRLPARVALSGMQGAKASPVTHPISQERPKGPSRFGPPVSWNSKGRYHWHTLAVVLPYCCAPALELCCTNTSIVHTNIAPKNVMACIIVAVPHWGKLCKLRPAVLAQHLAASLPLNPGGQLC